MNRRIPFYKYTSCGNNFLIVDETKRPYLSEAEKSRFACVATNLNFGVGADGVIFLQPCSTDVFKEINSVRNYWKNSPKTSTTDLLFRLFEPNGAESFSCGNGLMCVASYLYLQYDMWSKEILTQIPTNSPKVITIGTNTEQESSWADMGVPHRVPEGIVNLSNTKTINQEIDIINNLKINFREHDLRPFSNETSLNLKGYLVYTGEPHLVILVENGISIESLTNLFFASSKKTLNSSKMFERRIAFGSWLIHHIGTYLNRRYVEMFPQGINVDFVKIPNRNSVIEYRCYERGINKETLACGTGAMAVAVVAERLKLIKSNQFNVLPERCRWYEINAAIKVKENKNGWTITSRPKILLEGCCYFSEALRVNDVVTNFDKESDSVLVNSNRKLNYEHFISY